MNYNQYSYYRANPYYNEGYIPPIAHLNRKKPEYLTELPQGQKHLHDSGRKHFTNLKFKNNIQQQGILASPEKYPYQNRIALDKSYLRSLNTIDIQGAYSNSLVSSAIKNRMRAQQVLKRQNKQLIDNQFDKYRLFGKSDDQQRRQLANKQLQNQQLKNLVYKRDNYHTKQKIQQKKRNNSMHAGQLRQSSPLQSMQILPSSTLDKHNHHQQIPGNLYSQNQLISHDQQNQQYRQKQQYILDLENQDRIKQNKKGQLFLNKNIRYQMNNEQQRNYNESQNILFNNIKRNWTPRRMQKRLSVSGPVPKDYIPIYGTINKQEHRKMNPTYISESFGLTARNVIGS